MVSSLLTGTTVSLFSIASFLDSIINSLSVLGLAEGKTPVAKLDLSCSFLISFKVIGLSSTSGTSFCLLTTGLRDPRLDFMAIMIFITI